MSGPLRFQNIVFSLDGCPALDEYGPVVVEVTARGDLVIHNYDRDVDDAALALGLDPEDLTCMALEHAWEMVVGQGRIEWIERLPKPLRSEAQRVIGTVRVEAERSLKKSNYDAPFRKDRGRLGEAKYVVNVSGINPTGDEFIRGKIDRHVMQGPGRRERHYLVLRVYMSITVQGYMDVLNLIHDGLVSDQRNKKLAVVGVDDILDDDRMAVRVGHQGRDMTISTRPAIISRRGAAKKNNWKLEMWL
jgi:hypothetical protein